jgi:hypothetical protein
MKVRGKCDLKLTIEAPPVGTDGAGTHPNNGKRFRCADLPCVISAEGDEPRMNRSASGSEKVSLSRRNMLYGRHESSLVRHGSLGTVLRVEAG